MTSPEKIVAGVGILALVLVIWQSTQPGELAKGLRLLALALFLISIVLLVQQSGADENVRLWTSVVLTIVGVVLAIIGMRTINAGKRHRLNNGTNTP